MPPRQTWEPPEPRGRIAAMLLAKRRWSHALPPTAGHRVLRCLICALLASCQHEDAARLGAAPRAAGAASPTSAPAPGPTKAYDAYRQPERLIAALHIEPGAQIAELGAGGGYLTGRLARATGKAGRVVATDIDDAALRALRERTKELAQVETRHVTASASGLEPGRYDLILLAQVDHLLADRPAYLRTLPAALKPGGRIALTNSDRDREALASDLAAIGWSSEDADAGLPGQFLLLVRPPR